MHQILRQLFHLPFECKLESGLKCTQHTACNLVSDNSYIHRMHFVAAVLESLANDHLMETTIRYHQLSIQENISVWWQSSLEI